MSEKQHPLPICEALLILGLTGSAVMRTLGLHENTWRYWKMGGVPSPETQARLLLLAHQTMKALRELQDPHGLVMGSILTRATTLITQQEAQWKVTPMAVLRGTQKAIG